MGGAEIDLEFESPVVRTSFLPPPPLFFLIGKHIIDKRAPREKGAYSHIDFSFLVEMFL